MSLHGANHNSFNSVWFVDGDDSTGTDAACGTSRPNNDRLTGGTHTLTIRGSGDPALMGRHAGGDNAVK